MIDVIVIGAGPAGVICAKRLAENGFSVKVYEKRPEIGAPKRCGEGLSESCQELIGKIPNLFQTLILSGSAVIFSQLR